MAVVGFRLSAQRLDLAARCVGAVSGSGLRAYYQGSRVPAPTNNREAGPAQGLLCPPYAVPRRATPVRPRLQDTTRASRAMTAARSGDECRERPAAQ